MSYRVKKIDAELAEDGSFELFTPAAPFRPTASLISERIILTHDPEKIRVWLANEYPEDLGVGFIRIDFRFMS